MPRKREIRQFIILFSLIAVITIMLGFIINVEAGMLTIVSTVIFGIAFFAFTKARCKSIVRISNQIDLMLHNANHLYIGELDEGELSNLHSEITKLTLRNRGQNNALKK